MLMPQMLFPGMAAPMIQTLKDLKEENDRLERLARMDGSRLQADAQFVLQRSMHCAMLIPSVMTTVSGGDAVQSSPDPIAEDPRKALVFEEGDDYAVSTMHSGPGLGPESGAPQSESRGVSTGPVRPDQAPCCVHERRSRLEKPADFAPPRGQATR